jgi:signal peptide peptidase SppA
MTFITNICYGLCIYIVLHSLICAIKGKKVITGTDIRGNTSKFTITKYNKNINPDSIAFSKSSKTKDNSNKQQNEQHDEHHYDNCFVFRFDNLSKLTKENYKLNKNSDEFDNIIKFVNFVLTCGKKETDSVIIIISSPGGYAFEFEEAYTQLSRLRNNGFKTIALIDKMCASGGYMLACACNKIICSETSKIGSVGVIGQTFNYKKLVDKLGIEFFRFTTGKYKGGFPTSTDYTDEDIKTTHEDINQTLTVFKNIVQSARKNINIDQVLSAKVWYGKDALEIGLVDEINILDDYLMKLSENINIYYVNMPDKKENVLKGIIGDMVSYNFNSFLTSLDKNHLNFIL